MTKEEILAMEAGPEMNALVAEKVMGWIWIDGEYGHPTEKGPFNDCECPSHSYQKTLLPRYSTDIAAAWEVVNKLGRKSINKIAAETGLATFLLVQYPNGTWKANFSGYRTSVEADTVPLAICRAALLSKPNNILPG